MADQSILIQALKDHFRSAEPQPAATTPDVIPAKNSNGPTLVRIPGTDEYEPFEKPRHLDSLSPEEKEQINKDAEKRQQERVAVGKRIAAQVEQDHYRQLCESQMAPVGSTGRPAVTFLADLKKVFAPPTPICLAEHPDFLQMSTEERVTFLLASPEYVDWPRTYMLRQTFLEGFEKKKSARPDRVLGPVSDQEIMEHVEKLLSPEPPKIVNNRYVR
jgi:hypothetical protein